MVGQAMPLLKVEALVQGVEDACRVGRSLSNEELSRVDTLRTERLALLACGEDPTRLRSFGERLWYACAAPGAAVAIAGLPQAKLRQIACELFCSSFAGARDTEPSERAKAAAHWFLAGKAWRDAGQDQDALQCFQYAAEPWASLGCAAVNNAGGPPGLEEARVFFAEVAAQAYLEIGELRFGQEHYQDAFDSLAQARDSLGASAELREVMLDPFLRTCYQQAVANRQAGNTGVAIELLNLSLAALQVPGQSGGVGDFTTTRARLLRELALCYADVPDTQLSLLHVEEAVKLLPEPSCHQTAALKVWFHILCQIRSRSAKAGVDSTTGSDHAELEMQTREVALRLMQERAVPAAECLVACMKLQEQSFSEDLVYSCLDELGNRERSNPDAFSEVLAFRLRLAYRAAEAVLIAGPKQSVTAALDRINMAAEQAETAVQSSVAKPVLLQAAAMVLWSLGSVLRDAGRNDDAVHWFSRMLCFLSSPVEHANCWCAIAVCHWQAGRTEETRHSTEKALAHDSNHLHASLLRLVSLPSGIADVPGAEADENAVVQLLDRLQAHPSFLPMHASQVAEVLLRHPRQELFLAALEVLARCLLRESKDGSAKGSAVSVAVSGETANSTARPLSGLRVVRELVLRALLLKRPDAELARYFDLAADHMVAKRVRIANEFRGEETHATDSLVFEVRYIFGAAWSHGKQLGQQSRWVECIAILEVAHRLLEQLDLVDVHEVIEARAWCLAMVASAALQHVKDINGKPQERKELLERALHNIDCVHQLCRKAKHLSLQSKGKPGVNEASSAIIDGRIFRVLVLLEFDVRCVAGDSELQLKCFVDQSTSNEAIGIKSLLAMSKIASAAWMRRLAIHCLQRYLRVSVGAHGVADYSECAVAYREMISMHASRNESFKVYEGILQLLSGSAGSLAVAGKESGAGETSGETKATMQGELRWLVSTAWNNGVHFCKLQQYRWGERWMGKSLELAKFCPGIFNEEDMHKHYMQCLQHCSE